MRGKGRDGNSTLWHVRITPACAGKSIRAAGVVSQPEDHPRVCGEKGKVNDAFRAYLGSPPRVRGKVQADRDAIPEPGITPACAGKSARGGCSASCPWDHPRVCGEKAAGDDIICLRPGSPPRVRGKVQADRDAIPEPGITPACAGKSARGGCSASCPWDHPRVCGEKAAGDDIICLRPGSPPRVRGKLQVFVSDLRQLQILCPARLLLPPQCLR